MTSIGRRTLKISAASCSLLCGMCGSAMSQDAAQSTQLPGITVTAPSPIVRRNVTPARTPVRVSRVVPGRNREPAAQPQPTPVAAAPQQGVLPIVTDQFATVTVSCFPSPALPAPPLRRAPRAGRSSGVSTSIASVSSKTATTLAAPPISARTISCQSILWRQTRSKSSAVRRRCATDRHQSAVS